MQKNGITSDVNSLFEKKGGKLDNGKYAVGRIPKKMPTLSDFQKKLKDRGKCEELSELLVPFLKVIHWVFLIVKVKLLQMQRLLHLI